MLVIKKERERVHIRKMIRQTIGKSIEKREEGGDNNVMVISSGASHPARCQEIVINYFFSEATKFWSCRHGFFWLLLEREKGKRSGFDEDECK
jgi:Mlc titration factor MtfA (ptsG expression regulator)